MKELKIGIACKEVKYVLNFFPRVELLIMILGHRLVCDLGPLYGAMGIYEALDDSYETTFPTYRTMRIYFKRTFTF